MAITEKTVITYNGSTIASLEAGQTATLSCQGKKMKTDIVVEAPESEGESAKLYGIEVTPTKAIQNVLPEGDYDGFNEVIVKPIPDEYIIPNLQEKTATENGEVTADEGYTGLSKVTVNVPSEEPNLISKTITKNGTYKASEDVDDELAGTWLLNDTVPTVEGTSAYWTLNATMSADGYNVTIPYTADSYTYDGMAINSSAFNNSPRFMFATYGSGSFVNGQRFLYFGDDYTGSAVSSAGWYYHDGGEYYHSENTYTPCSAPILKITSKLAEVENGDKLLAYLQANATKKAVDGYSEVIVNVEAEDSAIPAEVSTEAEMTALLESGEVGGVYKYTGETTDTYENGAFYLLEEEVSE